MWKVTLICLVFFFLPIEPAMAQRQPVEKVGDLWLDISIGPPLVSWFNSTARPTDIVRVENPIQFDLFDQVTVGRKLIIFKSAAEAERLLPNIAGQIDIIGYNLEHGPANPADEQAAPVESARRMRALADEYSLTLAFGPDHDFAVSDGVAIAPYVDIFVLQVQRVQTEPQAVYDFILPIIPQLRAANPDLEVTIQVRTEGDVTAIVDLITSLKDELDGVSILTSPETVPVAEALVAALRPGTAAAGPDSVVTAGTDPASVETAVPAEIQLVDQSEIIQYGSLFVLLMGSGILALVILSRSRPKA